MKSKKSKKFLSVLIAFVVMITVFGSNSISAEAADFDYTITIDGTITITSSSSSRHPVVTVDLSDKNFEEGKTVAIRCTVNNSYGATLNIEPFIINQNQVGQDINNESTVTSVLAAFEVPTAEVVSSHGVALIKSSDVNIGGITFEITWSGSTGGTAPDSSSASSATEAHSHSYTWEDGKEATEDEDGEIIYRCECGEVLYRMTKSAYNVFNKNTMGKIKNAKPGETVKIETSKWISFHKMVIEALRERPDVTLEISFLSEEYKGDRYVITIPAGSDLSYLIDENGFVGFLYLGGKYGIEIR